MDKRSTDPRPPVNQGIDANNATVLRHTQIYESLLSHVTEGSGNAYLALNPYGTAPLSGYVGVWATSTSSMRVQISDDIGSVPIEYAYTPVIGANLVPLIGLSPASANQLVVTIPGAGTVSTVILTNPLPPTDADIGPPEREAFPIFEVTSPLVEPPTTISELYFVAYFNRGNVGLDHNGTVRWYSTKDIPAFSFTRLHNGNFLAVDETHNLYKQMLEFDLVGRIYTVYNLDNECHHSIVQLPDGNILIPSEYSEPREGEEEGQHTIQDGLSIIDLSTGLEVAYYDIKEILDLERPPLPRSPSEYTDNIDWLHINHSYYDVKNNLLISSGRHQAAFGITYDTAELVFAMAPHEGWGSDFQQYLLTPVDESKTPLYDFSNPSDVDQADKEFWNWGQHSVIEVPTDAENIVEFLMFNNGNFRSRDESMATIPGENFSNVCHFRIDLTDMTVMKVFDYGRDEVGPRGYSSYVSTVRILENGNYLINFGGAVMDENGKTLTVYPGYTDIEDPLDGDSATGRLLLQEINPATKSVLLEITTTSGSYKTRAEYGAYYRFDVNSFQAEKIHIIPEGDDNMNRLYLATRLFNVHDRLASVFLCDHVDGWIDEGLLPLEHSFLPYRDSNNAIPDDVPDLGQAIFDLDIANLTASVGIACFFDGLVYDSGMGFELGFAYAMGMPNFVITTDYQLNAIGDSEGFYVINELIHHIAKVIRVADPSPGIEDYREQCEDIRNQAMVQLRAALIEEFGTDKKRQPLNLRDEEIVYDYYLDANFQYSEFGRYMLSSIIETIEGQNKTYIIGDNKGDVSENLSNLAKSNDIIFFAEEFDPDVDTSLLQGIAFGIGKKPILYSGKMTRHINGDFIFDRNPMCVYSAKAIARTIEELLNMIKE